MRKVYVATIQVVVNAESEVRAADGISALMTELTDPLFLIDWGYLRMGGQLLYPTERWVKDEEDYEEGDFLA